MTSGPVPAPARKPTFCFTAWPSWDCRVKPNKPGGKPSTLLKKLTPSIPSSVSPHLSPIRICMSGTRRTTAWITRIGPSIPPWLPCRSYGPKPWPARIWSAFVRKPTGKFSSAPSICCPKYASPIRYGLWRAAGKWPNAAAPYWPGMMCVKDFFFSRNYLWKHENVKN